MPKTYSSSEFEALVKKEGCKPIASRIDIKAFERFIADPRNADPYAMTQLGKLADEVKKEAAPGEKVSLLEGTNVNLLALFKGADDKVLIWEFWNERQRPDAGVLDGPGCLNKLAVLALGKRSGIGLSFPEQEDRAFMWKAPSVHPLQVLENAYQRVVHEAAKAPGADPLKAQSETLSRFFIQDAGESECFEYKPIDLGNGKHLAAVKMNHLIDTFYLFRLLVNYQVESNTEISDDLRAELSGDLTKLLHNGDKARMGWLSGWLTTKIAELGTKIEALNAPGKKRVIFFLKGGRALNFYLGTPDKGENDWDTQIVINPSLSAEDWYRCFTEVHDVMLVALKKFKAEFTELVKQNSAQFTAYLKDKAGPERADDEEIDENEVSDINSRTEHVNCKAELIDIGVPRRDSPSALEEWTHLSAPGALKKTAGVVYPHRDYYLNEYLMMVRDAFLPNADVKKAPKRITRFGLILESPKEAEESAAEKKHRAALPVTANAIEKLPRARRELFGIMISQFVEAYNFLQDKELAALFDVEFASRVANPPPLSAALAALLNDAQKVLASDVGVAHDLSNMMANHWQSRNNFFEAQRRPFTEFVKSLSSETNEALQGVRTQFALAGSFATRLHGEHLRLSPDGLEPVRRILIKLQCPQGSDREKVLGAVRGQITKAAEARKLKVIEAEKQSLVLYWSEKVKIGDFTYAPLVMKVRVAEQKGNQLPVLASIDGLPVLDLRYIAADYLKRTSKIDERGSRHVLASATAAVSGMLSRFDFDSDDPG